MIFSPALEVSMTRKKAWEGRLGGKLDPVFEAFNSSLGVDRARLAGEKLQTGRSRNDQVGTSVRMYVRREGHRVMETLLATMKALVERASEEMETPLPGLTHLQPAQVISLGHYLMSAFWALDRDLE